MQTQTIPYIIWYVMECNVCTDTYVLCQRVISYLNDRRLHYQKVFVLFAALKLNVNVSERRQYLKTFLLKSDSPYYTVLLVKVQTSPAYI